MSKAVKMRTQVPRFTLFCSSFFKEVKFSALLIVCDDKENIWPRLFCRYFFSVRERK
jgi:hypothetical protein